LLDACKSFNLTGIDYWLDYGTLLGIVRSGELLSHDLDLDIGMMGTTNRELIHNTLISTGFKFHRAIHVGNNPKPVEVTYSKAGVKIDIFFYKSTMDHLTGYLIDGHPPSDKVREIIIPSITTTSTIYRGQPLKIPKNPENRLIHTYGEEWMIPDKNWYTPRDALNSKIIGSKFNFTYEYN